ncbi:hypothetical protein [Halopseudomonas sp.]|uniref:hypothetical protein n=1 Tax=Halopseudomonas sp. TaxID=2901191 RepID=UPI00311D611A
MIERVEMALITWGDQYRRRGTVAMLQCTLGAMIDARGELIRSTALGNGYGVGLENGPLGAVGEAVERALVMIRQPVEAGGHGKVGVELSKLARVRYLTDPMPLVEQQTKRMGWRSQATYRSKLHQLHVLVEPILLAELPWLKRSA